MMTFPLLSRFHSRLLPGIVRRGCSPAAVLLAASVLLAGGMAHAQQGTGSIGGKVLDAGGATVPDAKVVITSQAKLSSTVVKTDAEGNYVSPPLPSGMYTVEVDKPSFGPVSQRDFELNDDQRAVLNFTLHAGAVSQEVTVQSDAPQLNTFNATLGSVIDNAAAEELPLAGSSALTLAQLDASVVSGINGTANDGFNDRGLNGSGIRIGGGALGSNANLLDGANNLQTVRGEILINATSPSLQEIRLQYGVISAQYGLTSGGLISMTTKAGSSQFHGQVYETFKNGALNAAAHNALPGVRPNLNYNDYGVAIGGPIRRDRAFFFGNYEEYRLTAITPVTITVPTVKERGGDFSDQSLTIFKPGPPTATSLTPRTAYPGNVIDPADLDPAALEFQKQFVPLPNVGDASTTQNNYTSNSPLIASQRTIIGRVDMQLTPRTSIFARYAYYQNSSNNYGSYGALSTIASTRNDNQTSQDLDIGVTQVLSGTLLNDIRLAVGRSYLPVTAGSSGQNWPSKLGLKNVPQDTLPALSISGYGITISTNEGLNTSTDPEVSDTVTWLLGRHSLHIGALARVNEAYRNLNTTPSGSFSFNSSVTSQINTSTNGNAYASFLIGKPYSISATVSAPSVTRNLAVDGFAQDDWRLNSVLTLNLGLRYDYQTVQKEKANGFSTLDLNAINPLNGFRGAQVYAGVNGQKSNFANEDYTNFGPRVGFAWLLSKKQQMVLRGGYAIYYVNTANLVYSNAVDEFGSNTTTYSAASATGYVSQFSNGLPYPANPLSGSSAGPSALLGQNASFQPAQARTPSSQQFILSLDKQFPKSTVIHISAFQNHGTHFPMVGINVNSLDPKYFARPFTFLNDNSTNPYANKVVGTLGNTILPNATLLRPYPYYLSVDEWYPHIGRFMGRGLQVQASRPVTKSLSLNMTYTYAKFLSDPLSNSLQSLATPSAPLQDNTHPHSEYSADTTDVTHRVSGFFLYSLPFGKGKTFLTKAGPRLNRIVGDWGITGILQMESGRPLSITGSNGYAALRPNYVPGVSLKLAHPSASKWFNTDAFSLATPTCAVGVPCPNPQPYYSFGNVPRTETIVRGPGAVNLSLNLTKRVTFKRVNADFQISAINAPNHPNLGTPGGSYQAPVVQPATGNPVSTQLAFGQITNTQSSRSIQITSRFRF
jgi:hypothetical protein